MVRTRLLVTGEWGRLRDVRLRALGDEPDAFGSSLDRERDMAEGEWRAAIERGPWWVAVDGDSDVGVVAGGRRDDPRTVWIYSMWVEPAQRGRGVAEVLLSAVVDWAVGQGAERLGLDVTDRVPRARSFYERFGFVPSGTTEPLPREPTVTLHEMTFDLMGQMPGPRPSP